jgi:hypothetical protein
MRPGPEGKFRNAPSVRGGEQKERLKPYQTRWPLSIRLNIELIYKANLK